MGGFPKGIKNEKEQYSCEALRFIIIDILCLFSTLWLSYLLWIPEREKGSRGDDYRAIGLVLVLAYLFIVFTSVNKKAIVIIDDYYHEMIDNLKSALEKEEKKLSRLYEEYGRLIYEFKTE